MNGGVTRRGVWRHAAGLTTCLDGHDPETMQCLAGEGLVLATCHEHGRPAAGTVPGPGGVHRWGCESCVAATRGSLTAAAAAAAARRPVRDWQPVAIAVFAIAAAIIISVVVAALV